MKRETRRSLDWSYKNIVRIYDFVHSDRIGLHLNGIHRRRYALNRRVITHSFMNRASRPGLE